MEVMRHLFVILTLVSSVNEAMGEEACSPGQCLVQYDRMTISRSMDIFTLDNPRLLVGERLVPIAYKHYPERGERYSGTMNGRVYCRALAALRADVDPYLGYVSETRLSVEGERVFTLFVDGAAVVRTSDGPLTVSSQVKCYKKL